MKPQNRAMVRSYPALELSWPAVPAAGDVERALPEIDVDAPTAVEDRVSGVRVFYSSVTLRVRAATRLRLFSPPPTCVPIEVPDDDWAARSQASLGALTIERLVVAPPWAAP